MSIKNVSFLVLALGPKMSKVAHVSLSSSLRPYRFYFFCDWKM